MYKVLLFILTSAVLFVACNSTTPDHTVKSTNIDFSFVNEDGEDLLNPSHPHAITEQNTDLYYLINGEKEKVFDKNLDYPKHFFIPDEKLSDKYFMRVFPNIVKGQKTAISYIQFSDTTMDTIKVEYTDEPGLTVVTKVWYNGALRFNINDKNQENIEYTSRYITITREVE